MTEQQINLRVRKKVRLTQEEVDEELSKAATAEEQMRMLENGLIVGDIYEDRGHR